MDNVFAPITQIYSWPPIADIKISFLAQIARIWAYKMFPGGNLLISDMDMMPLNGEYFKGNAEPYSEDTIVSYCADAAEKFDGTHPMCYILANSNVIASLIEEETWEEFATNLARDYNQGWSTDQSYLTKLLEKHGKVASLHRGFNSAGVAANRIDRIDWRYNPDDVRAGKYYDAHLPRPFKGNEAEIQKLLDLIP